MNLRMAANLLDFSFILLDKYFPLILVPIFRIEMDIFAFLRGDE